MTDYTVIIMGSVYALEPIRSCAAYANATFTNPKEVSCVVSDENPCRLDFRVLKPEFVTADTTIAEITVGLITGTDGNVTWTPQFSTIG